MVIYEYSSRVILFLVISHAHLSVSSDQGRTLNDWNAQKVTQEGPEVHISILRCKRNFASYCFCAGFFVFFFLSFFIYLFIFYFIFYFFPNFFPNILPEFPVFPDFLDFLVFPDFSIFQISVFSGFFNFPDFRICPDDRTFKKGAVRGRERKKK